jgi:glycosyltransferase involved in cell wall biosynthesis
MDHAPGGFISWRVEKSAISALKYGHEVFFGGPGISISNNKTFLKTYEINWTARARRGFPYYWHCVKKQTDRILKEVKPDIVHANNIFSAKMISEFGVPFIYDDHEYWPSYARIQAEPYNSPSKTVLRKLALSRNPKRILRSLARRFNNYNSLRLAIKWEKEIVSSTPTIVTTDKVADELRVNNHTNKVFTMPNFPNMLEVKDFERPEFHTQLSSVFAGLGSIKPAHKNMEGLTDIFENHDIGNLTIIGLNGEPSAKINYTGFISTRQSMYNEMFRHSIGLIPFKRHWSHPYISLNKAYEYAHAGLFVMCTSSYETMVEDLKEGCTAFDDYNDLISKLAYFKDNLEELYDNRLRLFEFARHNLIWENYENNIFHAYQLC